MGGITLYLIVLVLGYYFTCLGFRTKNSRYTSIGLAILITSTAIPGFILSMHIKIILENFVNPIDSFPLLNILFFSIILAILIPPFVKFSEGISESSSDKVLGVCGAIIGAAGGYYILLLIAVTGSSGIASIIIGLLFAVILINAAKRCR